jgi:hypothetical protein
MEGIIHRSALASEWYSTNLTSGLTQFRLRFKLDNNNNSIANYLSL